MPRVPWWLVVLAATAVGAGAGAGIAAAGHVDYKASADVVVSAKGGPGAVRPLLPNLRELATSSLLAGNVDSTLRLPGSPDSLRKRLRASTPPDSQVVTMSVTDRKRDRARQIAQEAALVLVQLVQARFGTGKPALSAAILDPAHIVSHRGRHFVRDPLIGAAVGLVLALVALLARRRGVVGAPTDEKLAEREQQLKQRIDVLTQRERALAKRAGELAQRERALQSREAEIRAAPPAPEPTPVPEPVAVQPEPLPVPEPQPGAQPQPEPAHPAVGAPIRLNINDLERLIDARSDAPPDVVEGWRTYLFFLREHAALDGRLPASFESLVVDVFGDVLG